jgi:hypothetical protein
MLFAPVVHMCLSYWYLSNQQIFGNVVVPLKYIDDILKSGHTLVSAFTLDPASNP